MGLNEDERAAVVSYRIAKSKEIFREALKVAELSLWNLTANRLYYSAYQACSALLIAKGYTARTHSGVIRLIGQNFIATGLLSPAEGQLLSNLLSMRQAGDYDDMFDWEEEDVRPRIHPTLALIEHIISLI